MLKIDLQKQGVTRLPVTSLLDVHEASVIGSTLWIFNTALDEAVAYDLSQERVYKRVGLTVQQTTPKISTYPDVSHEGKPEVVDKFHCKQLFEGYEGDLYTMVHCAVGKQLVQPVTQKLFKRQGNGGVSLDDIP